jgi:hypothetical protein
MAREANGGGVTIRLSVKDGEKVRDYLKSIGAEGSAAFEKLDQSAKRPNRAMVALSDVMGDLRGRAEGMVGELGSFGLALGRLGPAGIAAGAALGGAVLAIRTTASALADLQAQANRAGLDVEAFQELKFAAETNRVAVDALVDGMKELQLRADEFAVTGQGAAAEAFGRLGFRAAELRDRLKDVPGFLSEVLGRLEGLDRASQIRILDELFGGTAGEEFLKLLADGAVGIEEATRRARELGLVFDRDMIRKMDEVDRRFREIGTTIDVYWKGAVLSVLDVLDDMLDKMREVGGRPAEKIREELALNEEAIAKARGWLGSSADTLIANLERRNEQLRAELARRDAAAANAPAEVTVTPGAGFSPVGSTGGTAFPNGAVDQYVKNVIAAESGGDANARNPASTATGLGQFIESTWLRLFKQAFPDRAQGMADAAILALRRDADISRQMIEAYAAENADILRRAGVSVDEAALHLAHFLGAGDAAKVLTAASGTPLRGLIQDASIAANPTILGGGRTVNDAIAYAQRRANSTRVAAGDLTDTEKLKMSVDDLFAAFERETDALGRVADARKVSTYEAVKATETAKLENALRRAGIEDLEAYRGKIDEVTAARAREVAEQQRSAAAAEAAKRSQQELNDAGREFAGTMAHAWKDGANGLEAFSQALERLSDRLLDMGLDTLFAMPAAGAAAPAGGGLLDGIISGIGNFFGGFFADGGTLAPGHWGIAGERGPEPIFGGRSGITVVPNGGGAASSRPVNLTVNVSPNGIGDKDLLRQVEAMTVAGAQQVLAVYDRSLPGRLARRQADEG